MILTLIVPPQPAITLEDAKLNLRLDHDDEDFLIARLIDAAHMRVQREAGYLYGTQTWQAEGVLTRDFMPDARPVTGIVSVMGLDDLPVDGVSLSGGWFTAAPWPAAALRIRFTAGHAIMPEDLKHAMHMLIAAWYENRSAVGADRLSEHDLAATSLIGLHRRMFC